MIGRRIVSWLGKPFHGVQEAKRELGYSQDDVPRVNRLANELRRIEKENHITQRVHRAMRGQG